MGNANDAMLLRGALLEELRAAGCCAAWRLRALRCGGSAAGLAGLLLSAEGMVFCAARGAPSLGTARLGARALDMRGQGVFVEWSGRLAVPGGARVAFLGAGEARVRLAGVGYCAVLAAHGARVTLEAPAGSRVDVAAGAGSRVEVAGAGVAVRDLLAGPRGDG